MFRAGLRRILTIFVALAGVTAGGSLALGALAGRNLERSLAVGFYVVGAAILVGCFVVGVRGPLRADWGEEGHPRGLFAPRGVRRATAEERFEGKKLSLLLFALGLVLILAGAAADPTRRFF